MKRWTVFWMLIGLVGGSALAAEPTGKVALEPDATVAVESCCSSYPPPEGGIGKAYSFAEPPRHALFDPDTVAAIKDAVLSSDRLPPGRVLPIVEDEVALKDLTPSAPKTLKRFEGMNLIDAGHQGSYYIPPDTQVAASSTVVLEAANVGLRLMDRNGKEIVTQSLNNFFGENRLDLFDPKVHFDRLSGRFLIVALGIDDVSEKSFILLSVSRSADPQALEAPADWCNYRIKAKKNKAWADYPGLGANERFVAISDNHFKFAGNYFRAFVWALDKHPLVDNAASCPNTKAYLFKVREDAGGSTAFTITPAQHYSTTEESGAPLYLVSSQVVEFVSDAYTLWRVEDQGAGKKPRLTGVVHVGGYGYAWPPNAPQKKGQEIDTGDDRVMQAAYRDGKVWAVHNTGCSLGTGLSESCVRAIEITPGQGVTFEENYGGGDDWFYFYPGVAINARGDVATVFQWSRGNRFLGTGFNGKPAGANGFDKAKALQNGRCELSDLDGSDTNRSGDYVGIQTDPANDLDFWIAGEFTGTVPGFGCDWRTRVGRIGYP